MALNYSEIDPDTITWTFDPDITANNDGSAPGSSSMGLYSFTATAMSAGQPVDGAPITGNGKSPWPPTLDRSTASGITDSTGSAVVTCNLTGHPPWLFTLFTGTGNFTFQIGS